MKNLVLLTPLLSALPGVLAWGALGHETVGYVAQNFISSATKTWAANILADTSSDALAAVATWADSYRETTAGAFSAPYHFIDALDNPPTTCNVVYSRDCGSSGCVIKAISNYTGRVTQKSLSAEQVNEALKFIIHFVGDIHQPLHDENLDLGGNEITVKFNKTSTNLHAVWDTSIPETYAGVSSSLTTAKAYATKLTAAINTGAYASQKSGWLTGMTTSDVIGTATVWAKNANANVCTVVIPHGVSAVEDQELGPTGTLGYYQSAIPTVNLLLAQAGYRLAAWLNLIATGTTGL
ncbi:hypothetical protein MMC25_005193 [Agyrium rufum]|nr:hypothetical protein [Agyrium rufum]